MDMFRFLVLILFFSLDLTFSQDIKWMSLEKALEETKGKMDFYLRNSKQSEERNENLKSLWKELQQQNETKDQQIKALQNLNRSLSVSLNQKKQNIQQDTKSVSSSLTSSEKKSEKESLSKNHVLADIHFD